MRYEFGGLIFGGAYFGNFMVYFYLIVNCCISSSTRFVVDTTLSYMGSVRFSLMYFLIYEKKRLLHNEKCLECSIMRA